MIKDLKNIVLDDNEYLLAEKGWGKKVVENTIVQKFLYDSEGNNVSGYVSLPKYIKNKLPVIIWNNGGDNKSGLLDDFLAKGILGEIASWNYAVFASQFKNVDGFKGSEVNNIINLISAIESFDIINTSFIGMEGWSRGGMMSYMTLTKTDKIKCAVIIAGLADLLRNQDTINKNNLENFTKQVEPAYYYKLKKNSAVNFADKISKNTSVLLIHGTADNKVAYQDSIDMYNKLKSYNIYGNYKLKLIEGGDHYLRNSRKEVSELRKNWYDSHLKL